MKKDRLACDVHERICYIRLVIYDMLELQRIAHVNVKIVSLFCQGLYMRP